MICIMSTAKLVFVVLTTTSCTSAYTGVGEQDQLCLGVDKCHHNKSGLCGNEELMSCDRQLRSIENRDGRCHIQKITDDCYMDSPSNLSDPEEVLVSIQAYFHKTWMGSRAAFNLSFLSPGWRELKFRYQDLNVKNRTLCRHIFLSNVNLPLTDDLMWDCLVFERFGDDEWDTELTVISSEGKGGTYRFKSPNESRIEPGVTSVKDWQVFFFVHFDHVERSPHLPVTIQVAPFKNKSYNVSLVKCLDGRHCQQWTSWASKVVNDSEISHGKPVLLPSCNTPATYAVTLQMVSPNCSHDGCFISFSPTFEIKQSKVGTVIGIVFGLVLIFVFAFFITLHHRVKENKKLVHALKEKPTTVLLVYLPENQCCLDLVKMYAVFLKEVCYVHPYVIDTDVGCQDPNYWIMEHMNKADRVLFLVPGNVAGESITPIRDQWVYALHYLNGHYFATKQVTDKVATVILPFSADVPWQVANVKRFKLMEDMDLMLTWIHSGTWLDLKFIWGPQIRSPVQNEITYTFSEIKEAVLKTTEVTEYSMFMEKIQQVNQNSVNQNLPPIQKIQQINQNVDNPISSLTHFINDSEEDPFDPDIPNIKMLLMLGQETIETRNENQLSSESSDEDCSIFL